MSADVTSNEEDKPTDQDAHIDLKVKGQEIQSLIVFVVLAVIKSKSLLVSCKHGLLHGDVVSELIGRGQASREFRFAVMQGGNS